MSQPLDQNLLLSIFRLCVWLVLLSVIFVPLERLFALHSQKIFRKAILTDVTYYFLISLVPGFLLGTPLALVAWLVHHAIPSGFTSAVTVWPDWLRILAALVAGDIGAYWGHRWTHEIPLLWRFHAIHRSAEHVDFLVSTRSHPGRSSLEILFRRCLQADCERRFWPTFRCNLAMSGVAMLRQLTRWHLRLDAPHRLFRHVVGIAESVPWVIVRGLESLLWKQEKSVAGPVDRSRANNPAVVADGFCHLQVPT